MTSCFTTCLAIEPGSRCWLKGWGLERSLRCVQGGRLTAGGPQVEGPPHTHSLSCQACARRVCIFTFYHTLEKVGDIQRAPVWETRDGGEEQSTPLSTQATSISASAPTTWGQTPPTLPLYQSSLNLTRATYPWTSIHSQTTIKRLHAGLPWSLKLVKSRVFPLIYVIWPQILLASSFSHSFSSRHCYLLTNSLSPFKYHSKVILLLKPTTPPTSAHTSYMPGLLTQLYSLLLPICLALAYLWCLLLVVCLSPLKCKLHKGRDLHLINSFVYHYLGNENRALLRALENRTGLEETINNYQLSKAIN